MIAQIFGPLVVGAATLIDSYSTQRLIGGLLKGKHTGSPRISPGSIGAAARQIYELRQRGLEPVAVTDPSTGNLVVGTRDQDLGSLVAEKNVRDLLTPTREELREFNRKVMLLRQGLDPETGAPVPTAVQQPTTTARVVAPGVVSRGTSPVVRSSSAGDTRRGGPCAGATSSLQRIRCNIGGLA